jgi:hypothetical protein
VLGPGGVAGFYSLGISHYLLNHFDLKEKRLVGFSAGSFTLLFMRLSQEKRNSMLQEIFRCNEKSASSAMRHIMEHRLRFRILEGLPYMNIFLRYNNFHGVVKAVLLFHLSHMNRVWTFTIINWPWMDFFTINLS